MENTEIVFILDSSGSMSSLEADTVGGYHSFLNRQKEITPDAVITTVLFCDTYEMIRSRVSIDQAKLKKNEYAVGGMTALYDAVGRTIMEMSERKPLPDEDPSQSVIFVITTDGYENASRKFDNNLVRHMIADKRALGWQFLFFGANIDVDEVGESLGILEEDIEAFEASSDGICKMMVSMAIRVNDKISSQE